MVPETQRQIWLKIIAKAWADEDSMEQLLADPAAVLEAEGIELPQGARIKLVQLAEDEVVLVLPPKPSANTPEACEERLAAQCSRPYHFFPFF